MLPCRSESFCSELPPLPLLLLEDAPLLLPLEEELLLAGRLVLSFEYDEEEDEEEEVVGSRTDMRSAVASSMARSWSAHAEEAPGW